MSVTAYRLEVRPSAIDRRGCFAIEPIAAGAVICEYEGERISAAEALRREQSAERPGIYTVWVDDTCAIDGWVGGNASIYLNHACEPNCEWEFEGRRVFIRAVQAVAAGAELTIDYAYDADGVIEPCVCGGAQCRGRLNAPRD